MCYFKRINKQIHAEIINQEDKFQPFALECWQDLPCRPGAAALREESEIPGYWRHYIPMLRPLTH